MDVTVLHPPLCPTARAAAVPIPPARTLRIRLNPACFSRPDAADAEKQDRMGSSHNKEPPAKRHSGAADEKGNKNAPAVKIGNLLRPCSRGDEAPRSPLGGNTKRRNGGAAVGHTGAPPAAKRKATTPDSGKSKRRASSSRVPIATKKQQVGGDGAASSSPSPRSSDSEGTVRALLTRARPASDAIRRRDIERLRAQARWELDQMVRTVEFNDPFITPQDVLR
jgi:hypothetical protein